MILSDTTGLTKGSVRRVDVKCEECGVVTSTRYCNYYKGQKKRDFDGVTYCRACNGRMISSKYRTGVAPVNKGIPNPAGRGEKHPRWKGGSYIAPNGYRMVLVSRSSKKKWKCYKREHVVVAERMLGRSLCSGESVHHIDGDKLNNDEANLWIAADNERHHNAHYSLQKIGYDLVRRGLVVFDPKKGEYMLKL